MDHMEKCVAEYLRSLDCSTLDQFKGLFYEAAKKQLEVLSSQYEAAQGSTKELIDAEGVEANMILWLGEELLLISLYHSFERKIKEIIKTKNAASSAPGQVSEVSLHRWDAIKEHVPDAVKNSKPFQEVNVLRVLVNCFKHGGVVSEELHRLSPSFGEIDQEIVCDAVKPYDSYKAYASTLICDAYDNMIRDS
jgi:hypothetical protein